MSKLANVKPEERLIGRYPDEHGHFGPYGGTFIAETLVRPVEELRDAYERCAKDPEFLAELDGGTQALCGPAVAAVPRTAVVAGDRRRPSVSEARGSEPYRRAQGEQHRGPGPAREADGQDPHHRGDRGRPARRGGRDRRGPARARVRRLHGRRGHRTPGAQRLSHEAARRRGGVRGIRLEDPQGRPQRGDARLGEQRRRTRTTSSARWRDRTRIR